MSLQNVVFVQCEFENSHHAECIVMKMHNRLFCQIGDCWTDFSLHNITFEQTFRITVSKIVSYLEDFICKECKNTIFLFPVNACNFNMGKYILAKSKLQECLHVNLNISLQKGLLYINKTKHAIYS